MSSVFSIGNFGFGDIIGLFWQENLQSLSDTYGVRHLSMAKFKIEENGSLWDYWHNRLESYFQVIWMLDPATVSTFHWSMYCWDYQLNTEHWQKGLKRAHPSSHRTTTSSKVPTQLTTRKKWKWQVKSTRMNTPVRFKSQNSDRIINKYTSSSLLTTVCTNYAIATISNLQMIVPTVNDKTIKIMSINLKMNVKGAVSRKHGIPVSPSFD